MECTERLGGVAQRLYGIGLNGSVELADQSLHERVGIQGRTGIRQSRRAFALLLRGRRGVGCTADTNLDPRRRAEMLAERVFKPLTVFWSGYNAESVWYGQLEVQTVVTAEFGMLGQHAGLATQANLLE